MLRTCSSVIALTATAAALSVLGVSAAHAETLALKCEGTKIITEVKDPGVREISPGFRDLSPGKKTKGQRTREAKSASRQMW